MTTTIATILHWNIHMWHDATGAPNATRVRDLIGDLYPDVVSLVEVDEPWGDPVTLRHLADDLGYRWIFTPAFEHPTGGFGNALLTRAPILAVQQWDLLTPRLYDGTEPTEQRTALAARIQPGDTALWVATTHLPRHDTTARTHATSRLARLLATLPDPWAIAGDFNQPPDHQINAHVLPNPTEPTHPAEDPTEPIDYILLHGTTGHAQILTSDASDHLPVHATINAVE